MIITADIAIDESADLKNMILITPVRTAMLDIPLERGISVITK